MIDSEKYFVHETSIIDSPAIIGEGTKVWHWSHISKGCKIGSNCNIGQNAFLGENVTVGDFVKIQNNVSVYTNVIIEDYVFCGPSVVFTNVIKPRSFISRRGNYDSTIVKKGATLGANTTIICGNTIGEYSFIGAGSVVTKTVLPFALVIGNPGKHVGWVTRNGEKISLPLEGSGKWTSPINQESYLLLDSKLYLEE